MSNFRLDALPFTNSFAALPETHYTALPPAGLPEPSLIAWSEDSARLLGLATDQADHPHAADYFAGNRLLPGSRPLAAVYSGHQFGMWAGQLGDGRAHLLGGIEHAGGHWEIQLKGAGQTPYSRRADGRAVLRSSIREFLCSEAMAGLGIPTTRALCLTASPLPVRRESVETAAVVTRLAPSFVRFGSFEHWQSRQQTTPLRELADYVIDRFRPECRESATPYAALLADVSRRTADLMAQWMAVGFMHGVMNTDNMSILGLTLDYGPFGFMESFDAGHICNHSDPHGRYSYRNQPNIGQWNLYCLAEALLPLIGDPEEARETVDVAYGETFGDAFARQLRGKLGLAAAEAGDEDFFTDMFTFLQSEQPDFTLFFRRLADLPALAGDGRADAPVLDLCVDRTAAAHWLSDWRARQARTPWPDAARRAAMRAVNPQFVLRNWLAETAIRQAQGGDYSEIARLLDCLRQPYADQPDYAAYAGLPPDWARHLEVSCSS